MQDIKMPLYTLRKDKFKIFLLDVPLYWLLVCLFWPCEQESLIRHAVLNAATVREKQVPVTIWN